NGWERAVWFPKGAAEAEGQARLTLRRPAFHHALRRECRVVAEAVGVIELPGFSRFEVSGPRAAEALDPMIAGALPRVGRVGLSYVLTPKGGVLSEFTITRLSEDRFWLVGASSAEWHDGDLLERYIGGNARIDTITPKYSTLVVTGPKSRDLLSRLTRADLS